MVQIVTDSSTLYTAKEAQDLGIEIASLCVNIGDLEGREMTMDAVFATQGGPKCVAIQYIEK